MLDEFAEKRSMIKLLLDMLKGSAAKEVSDGMHTPEGMPDAKGLSVEKVSVMPGEMDKEEPMSPEGETLADKVMAHGDEPAEGSPAEESKESPDEEAHEMEDEAPLPAFASLMGKKRKK